jgi:hypothetical protein
MKLYRFSPMQTQEKLMEAIHHIHIACSQLCLDVLGEVLPNSGNVGVFCHYDDEYEALTKLRKELTESSDSWNQKYFKLHEPITFAAEGQIPETTYTYLYIRKPDPYRHHVGDADFCLTPEKYAQLKSEIENGCVIPHARLFPRADLDMIELYHPDIDVLPYIVTKTMAENVHVNQG